MKKVSVIGAGVAGLSAAIRLQAAGYQVDIFEKLDQPGGKMHRLEGAGFTFDVGPTIVMMPSIYEDVFRAAGKDPADYITMKRIEPMYDVYFKADPVRHYTVSSDLVELMKMAEKMGPETSLGFLQYLTAIYTRYQVAVEHFITRPFRDKKDIYNPFMLHQAMKLKTFDTADSMMAEFIPNKDLQQMMSFQTLYIGVSPKTGPSLYNMIPMIELLYGVWIIDGGMHAMALAMARLFEELGGVIHYNSHVEEILIEDKAVKGMCVNGGEVPTEFVVCDADFPYAMKELVRNETAKGKYTDAKIDKMDYSCSCLVFYWGVDGTYPELKTHNFLVSEDLDLNLQQIFDGSIVDDPSVYLHIPSKDVPDMAPEGKSSFYCLMPISELGTAKYNYDADTIADYRQKALDAVSHLPGLDHLEEDIEFEHVFTPNDFEKTFHAHRGATFGLQPTLRQSNHWRPQSKSKSCDGLYFTGSSTHPGAGVPIAIEGGRICAEELRRDGPEDDFSCKTR